MKTRTKEEAISDTCMIKVKTLKKHDIQLYKFYGEKMELIGLNFHFGTSELISDYHEPDTALFNTYLKVKQKQTSENKFISDKKAIIDAIFIWLEYVQPYYEINDKN